MRGGNRTKRAQTPKKPDDRWFQPPPERPRPSEPTDRANLAAKKRASQTHQKLWKCPGQKRPLGPVVRQARCAGIPAWRSETPRHNGQGESVTCKEGRRRSGEGPGRRSSRLSPPDRKSVV